MEDPENALPANILGHITWLLARMPSHQKLKLEDLEWSIIPPILHRQHHLFFNSEDQLLGFALWASLSDYQDQELVRQFHEKKPLRLPQTAWKSGENLWLMELVSPFASLENKLIDKMMGELARNIFHGRPFKVIRFNPDSEERELATLSSYELPYFL